MRKTGKRISVLLLVGMLLLTLGGCGAKNNATEAFDTMMQALQSGEKERVQPYYDLEAMASSFAPGKKAELETAVLETLKQMQYEVTSAEKVDGSHVIIKANVTTLDFSVVMNRFLEQMVTIVPGEEYQNRVGDSLEEYQNLMGELVIGLLGQRDIPTTQKTAELTMVKESGAWKLQAGQEDFINSMFGNFVDAINSLT